MGLNAIKNNPTQKEQHEFLRGNLSETKQGGKTFLVKEERLQQWMIAGLKALCYYFQLSLSLKRTTLFLLKTKEREGNSHYMCLLEL